MRSDALTMTLLYDYYGELLTEKQRGLFDLYYNQDYSLSEIASAAGISRQGVHDTLARAEELLEGYERSLGCIARDRLLQKALDTITQNAQALASVPEAAPQAACTSMRHSWTNSRPSRPRSTRMKFCSWLTQ